MKWLAISVSLVVLAAVIAAFTVVGSPAKQRMVRFDERKVTDLQNISSEVTYYWQLKSKLPASLTDLSTTNSGSVVPTDPQSNQAYEYIPKSITSFDVCASFNLSSTDTNKNLYPASMPYPVGGLYTSPNWNHGQGRTCFTTTIDPNLYKPIPPPVK